MYGAVVDCKSGRMRITGWTLQLNSSIGFEKLFISFSYQHFPMLINNLRSNPAYREGAAYVQYQCNTIQSVTETVLKSLVPNCFHSSGALSSLLNAVAIMRTAVRRNYSSNQ